MKKKLSILTYSLASGGAERVISILLPELQKEYEVTLFLMNDTIFYDIPKDTKIVYLENSNPNENGITKLLKLPILGWKYKILNKNSHISLSFMNRPNYINALAKIFGMSCLVILNERSTPSEVYSNGSLFSVVNKFLIRTLYRSADGVTANTLGGCSDLEKYFSIEATLFYNPFKISYIEHLAKEDNLLKKNGFTFVTVGTLNEIKNHKLIIDAIKDINATLWIIGDGVLMKYLKNYIDNQNMGKQVILLGRKKNPFSYLAKADAFVLSSNFEGFPNVIVEALACNLPIISVDCKSGPREILNPEGTIQIDIQNEIELVKYGILVPVQNKVKLAEAMNLIMNDKRILKNYSLISKNRAKDFDAKGIIVKYQAFLEYRYRRIMNE